MLGGVLLGDDIDSYSWTNDSKAELFETKRLVEEQYGVDELMKDVESDWNWGYLSGRGSAQRWVLGEDWGMLDR